MTEKLYYQDAYIRTFEATVLSSVENGGRYEILLDKTAFFPEEGGQYSDRGILGDVRVTDAVIKNGDIYHICDGPLTVGARVVGEIDFDERYEKMQCHSAEHILSGLIHTNYGYNNVGFHLGAEEVTMDIDHPLSADQLAEIERLANEVIYENTAITVYFPLPSELSSLEYRSKLDLTENVRIVNIGKYDSCACCAPHVARTGEIGLVKILDFAGLRGGVRIRIAAGRRAMRIFNAMADNLATVSHITSTPKLGCGEAVKRLSAEYEITKSALKDFRRRFYNDIGTRLPSVDGNMIIWYADASLDELRIVANKHTEKVSGILVLLSGSEGDFKYVVSSNRVDLKAEIKNINAALCGKGGGSSNMAQGSFATSLFNIEEYFGVKLFVNG